ncbi:MAG: prepilin-type N-terminal cleavage/methylation domain-containing protein [Terriglobia bacterium]
MKRQSNSGFTLDGAVAGMAVSLPLTPGSAPGGDSVPSQERKRGRKTANAGSDQGFSLMELLTVIAIIGIVSAMALVAFFKELPMIRADSSMELMEAQLRQAREIALDQRRNIQVTFSGTGTMAIVEQTLNVTTTPPTVTGTTTLGSFVLDPNEMVFTVLTGVPDTPDGFGNTSAVCVTSSGICFNNSACGATPALPCTITFQGDGTVVNSTGTNINGTVFMGTGGNSLTARAVTILGSTGRIKGYRYHGNAWF